MSPNSNRATRGPSCLDCGGQHGHHDTCPQRAALLDLLDADLAWLRAHPGNGGRHRRVHWAELAMLEGMLGARPPRSMRRGWTVHVRASGSHGGVIRQICDGHQVLAELIDEPVGGAR